MGEKPVRLFFGNPMKSIDFEPVPKGERKVFGEAQPKPANAPQILPGTIVLAFGNHPVRPISEKSPMSSGDSSSVLTIDRQRKRG